MAEHWELTTARENVQKALDDAARIPVGPTIMPVGVTVVSAEWLKALATFLEGVQPIASQEGAQGDLLTRLSETIDWIDQAGLVSDDQLETLHAACDRLAHLEIREGAQAGEVVAWQTRTLIASGWLPWRTIDEDTANHVKSLNRLDVEVRPLYAAPRAPDDAVRAAVLQEVLGCRTFNDRGEYAGWNITKLNRLVGNDGRFPVGR